MKKKPDVPAIEGIDLDFTPAGYFALRDLHLALPSDIKGKARRDLARKLAAEGRELPPELAAPELTPEDREMWGAIHPAMMGRPHLAQVGDRRPDQRARPAPVRPHRLCDRRRV